MVRGTYAEFLTENVWGADVCPTGISGKSRLAGAYDITGPVPVPLSATVCGEPVASSGKVRAADSAPASFGANTTPSVHVAPEKTAWYSPPERKLLTSQESARPTLPPQ